MLTDAQVTALRAKCFQDPVATAFFAQGPENYNGLMSYLNSASTFIVWRSRVPQDEIMMNGFDWVQVDNLSVGKARIWEWLFANQQRVINPTKANVRAGIAECWKGTTAMLAVQAVILGHCKRAATVAEKMLASGTGTDNAPGLMTVEGFMDNYDMGRLLYKDNGEVWAP